MCKLYSAILSSTILMSTINAQDVGEFGEIIGASYGVEAVNNTPEGFLSEELEHVLVDGKKVITGIKGQCVEYARRWLILRHFVYFSDVEYAKDIWSMPYGVSFKTGKLVPIHQYADQEAIYPPQVGDLIIYNEDMAPVTGHVAVVVNSDDTHVYVAEQNYTPGPWTDVAYSRKVPLKLDDQKKYSLDDTGVMGWLRFREE